MSKDDHIRFPLADLDRRTFLRSTGTAALLGATGVGTGTALAETDYPNRPIRLVVGFAAGGPTDIIARVVGNKLSSLLGQQIYVENRAGAGSNIATQSVARAEPDGYSLLLCTLTNTVNESLYKSLPFSFTKDFVPIVALADTGSVLIVHPSLDVKSVKELVALEKSKPGQIFYATAGKGTATHLSGELFNMMAGTKFVPVHYKGGGETIKDLLSGQIKVMFSTIPPVIGFIKEGKLRGLATTGTQREAILPDLPTIAESGLEGFEVTLWFGLAAPTGTPKEIVAKLNATTQQALKDPEVQATLARQGFRAIGGSSEQFSAFIRKEIDKWAKVVKVVGTIGN